MSTSDSKPPAAPAAHFSYLQNADQCTHCGYCLPVCPTYRVENHENQSPRGRVSAVLAFRQGHLSQEALADCLSQCLQCHACHVACPAGVKPARLAISVKTRHPTPSPRLARVLHRITDSHRLTALCSLGLSWYQGLGLLGMMRRGEHRWLPEWFSRWHTLLPQRRPLPKKWPAARNKPRRRVALLAGCMGRLFQPAIGRSAENLLTALGFQVVRLTGFGCCGFPHREEGHRPAFLKQAHKLLAAVERVGPVEAVVCDSGSCAVTARVYGKTLETVPELAEKAAAFSAKAMELTQFLAREGLGQRWPMADAGMGRLTFQSHCQSLNMMGIMKEPRELLKAISTEYQELPDGELCCGAGGSYMLGHPERSDAIRRLKLQAIAATEAATLVGTNPGCLINLEVGLRLTNPPVQTRHIAEILWTAFYNYRKEDGP